MEDKEELYKTINYLNSIKFKINTSLIDFLENDGKLIVEAYNQKLENKSEKLQFKISMCIDQAYSKLNIPFYLNHICDWRG